MRTVFLISIFLLSISILSNAKPIKEIKIGLSYNTLKWKITSPIFQSPTTYKYKKFNSNPNIRYSYTFNFKKLTNLQFSTILGYSTYGGKSKSDTTKFKEIYSNHCIELGIMPSYMVLKNKSIGIGFKLNYTPITLYKYYGTIYQSDLLPRKWFTENVSDRFNKLSTNIGINIKQQYNRFSFSFETWFGLSNLDNINSTIYKSNIHENNYRLLIGYSLTKHK
jgi:hypothetical protein